MESVTKTAPSPQVNSVIPRPPWDQEEKAVSSWRETAIPVSVSPSISDWKKDAIPDNSWRSSAIPVESPPQSLPERTLNLVSNLADPFAPFPSLKGETGKRIAGDLLSGVSGTVAGSLSVIPAAEEGLGIKTKVGDIAEGSAQWWRDLAKSSMPKNPNFADQLISGAGSMASFMVPGMGVGAASAKLLPKFGLLAVRLAPYIETGVATIIESATEAGDTFQSEIESGTSRADAAKSASADFWGNMILVGLTNKLGWGSEEARRFKKALKSAPLEAIQEAGQSILQSVSSAQPINWNEVVTSAGVGGIIGAGAGLITAKGVEETPAETIPQQEVPPPPFESAPLKSEPPIRDYSALEYLQDNPEEATFLKKRYGTNDLNKLAEILHDQNPDIPATPKTAAWIAETVPQPSPAKIEPTLPTEAARAPGVPAETLKTAPVTPEPAETTLMQEALKYKSPEEFVGAQGEPVYRGGEKLDINKINEQGEHIVETYYVMPNAKVATKADIPTKIYNAYEQAKPETMPEVAEPIVVNWAKENGFDAIDFRTMGETGAKESEIKIINPDVLKTKSQLTDIWKKAHEVPATVPAPPWEAPQGEIVSRETKVNQLEGTIGVEMEAVPSAQAAEGVQTTAMTPPPQAGTVPVSGAPQTPQSVSSQIADIVRSSKSAFEAQKRIKDLGFDVSYEEVKNAESLMKGGGTPDFSQHVIESLIKEMKQRVPGVEADYGLGSMGDITADDIADSLSIFDIAKEKVQNMATAIKHAMNSLEMPQNYLYAHEDSRPIAEGVIDANVKDMKMLHDVAKAVHKCKQVDNPAKIAEILNKADRNPEVDAMAELDKALAEKSITERDKDAVVNGFLVLHRFVRNQLIRDVMLSRFGVRITSNGIMHFVEYTLKNGEKRTGWVSGDEVEALKKKYQVKVGEQKESITIKRRSLETGKYIDKKMMVDSYDQARQLMAQEEQAIISELMPYGEGNYIPHGRMKGKFWVETYETMMDGTTQKISSIRVPDQTTANAFAKAIKSKIPMVEVKVKPHDSKMKNIPSMGSMMDVMLFLDKAGVDPTSEAGQRVINAYRAMSPLMSRLIHDKNLPGYRMDWDGMVEGMQMIAEAAARRSYRLDIRDLNDLLKDVQDEWRHNVAFKYLDALANTTEGNPLLNAARSMTYFVLLANKPSYILQNLTEPIWALARITDLNNPVKFWAPLEKEYVTLELKAESEGLLNPFVIYEERSKNLLEHMNVLGNMSESFSSRVVFNLGLRVARDKGLVGDAAYREAYQFLYNVGKPFYSQANKPIAFIGKGWENVRKFGFIVLNWTIDFINKFVRSNAKAMFNTVLAWIILAGFGTLPGGRKLMEKIRGRRFPRNARSMSMKEKFMLGGLSGMMGMSPYFLVPGAIKGGGGISVASPFRSITILQTQLERAYKDSKKYGILGAAQYAPLGGLQYVISGYLKTTKGFRERSGKSMRTFYKPRTLAEKLVTALSLTPFPVGEKYSREK